MKIRSRYSTPVMLAMLLGFSGVETSPAFGQVFDKDLEIRVDTLPALVTPSKEPMDVLVTSLAIVFRDEEICCGKDSALGDRVRTADPKSLKDVAIKLNGKHLLSDGRPFVVTADYMAPDTMNSGTLIGMITAQHVADAMECASVCC